MAAICTATGRDLAGVTVDARERAFMATVSAMLADPEWLLPIVAAQPQYRGTYYGLTAAALLEDLWYDALANWVARAEPAVALSKTPRGEPGVKGDYIVDSLPYSHKSGAGAQQTGVHWDALVAAQETTGTWTSAVPVTYVASGYSPVTGEWAPSSPTSKAGRFRAVWPRPESGDARGKVPALVEWQPDGSATLLAIWSSWPSFELVWPTLAARAAAGVPANHIELLWVPAKGVHELDAGTLTWKGRPGVYIFPADLLREVPTGKNNRATVLSKEIVHGLMASAAGLGLWTPMPMWFAAYAPPRPPDLYLSQRSEFDRRFSPASRPSALG
ncbi:hypothetical protein KIN34_06290 [Cellulomonas sp. DKR-3]|uniref:DUF3396 domain-containing protein n=1 Tax=Cellulomonas fulva TaxID=2835530 RepID=A0ABS5TXM1_9CELL|nr:hypothetical protein [Cellulomonas fulva]MBT0993895.1 hypothetical protein [Cellulomonas fulva]